jgi:hypothetical protein
MAAVKEIGRWFVVLVVVVLGVAAGMFLAIARAVAPEAASRPASGPAASKPATGPATTRASTKPGATTVDVKETETGQPIPRNLLE